MHHFSLFVCGLNASPPYGWAKQLAPYNSMGFMPLGPLSSTPHSYRIWNVSISWNTSGVSHKSDSVAGLAGIQNTAGMAVSMCVTLQRSAREVSAYACWGTTQIFGSYQNSCQLLICQPYSCIYQAILWLIELLELEVLSDYLLSILYSKGQGKRKTMMHRQRAQQTGRTPYWRWHHCHVRSGDLCHQFRLFCCCSRAEQERRRAS